jgi:hypothetical protein
MPICGTRANPAKGLPRTRSGVEDFRGSRDKWTPAFRLINWSNVLKVDLAPYPHLKAFMARVAARPKVREALEAEGLIAAA